MSMPKAAIVMVAACFASLPARAQFLGFGFESNIELTKQDIDIIHQTVDRQVHSKAVGAAASWTNPGSGNYGTITLLKKYTVNGRPCESVGYTLATKRRPVSPEHYMLDSCRQPDGTWKIT